MKRLFTIVLLLVASVTTIAAYHPSEQAEISVLVCSPGNDMYSQYGHAALRLRDTTQHIDEVFDYGVFYIHNYVDFVKNFLTGKMFYSVESQSFLITHWVYSSEGRGIVEYKLNLTPDEIKNICSYLQWNLRRQNKEYLYNFFDDNCATRLRDIIERFVPRVQWNEPYESDTWKNVVFQYSDKNSWIGMGIQLTLGLPADKTASTRGMMFSPEYFAKSLEYATVDGKKLVSQTTEILPVVAVAQSSVWNNACLIMWIVAIMLIFLSLWEIKTGRRVIWCDVVLFFITGILGCVITYISCFSVHSAVFPNFNLLWLMPTHVLFSVAWLVRPWRNVLKWYFVFTAAMTLLAVLISGIFGQQILATTWSLIAVFIARAAFFLKKDCPTSRK